MLKSEISPFLLKLLKKISKRNSGDYINIMKKIDEIRNSSISSINHYKNLKKPLQHLKRVHVNKHYVLLFSFNSRTRTVRFEDYLHHDEAYK